MEKTKKQLVFQLKITLSGSYPPIYRKFLVNSKVSLSQLHQIIQILMGWYDCHLHQFLQKNIIYCEPSEDLDEAFTPRYEMKNELDYCLDQVLTKPKDKMVYEYDFGDSWKHDLKLEKILEDDQNLNYPICLKGQLACPPEDCGGIWGYSNTLRIIQHPEDPEYEDTIKWLGGEFNPFKFDLDTINKKLLEIKIT